jgi:hypothetical protein
MKNGALVSCKLSASLLVLFYTIHLSIVDVFAKTKAAVVDFTGSSACL